MEFRLANKTKQANRHKGSPEPEQEAGRVADRVTRMPDPEVQRKKDGRGSAPEPPSTQARPVTSNSGRSGQPLPDSTRAYFEPRFAHDFSQVRVHANAQAADSAHAVNSQAYTVGRDIVFGADQYAPDTMTGRKLLAHELTHVVQQRGNSAPMLQRKEADEQTETNLFALIDAEFQAGKSSAELLASIDRAREWMLRNYDDVKRYEDSGRSPWLPLGAPGEIYKALNVTRSLVEDGHVRLAGKVYKRKVLAHSTSAGVVAPASFRPVTSVPNPLHVAGRDPPDEIYKVIRLAWTLDDGPTKFTSPMRKAIGPRPGTWFIMRNLLGEGDVQKKKLQGLADIQKQPGTEIAIHSMHPTKDHGAWFPARVSKEVPQVYDSTAGAMQDLRVFTKLLRDNGLTINFVRLPGGLLSEISAYLQAAGLKDTKALARKIIAGQDVSKTPAAAPVQRDYALLQATLSDLHLRNWGGLAGEQLIEAQSWEAESAPLPAPGEEALTRDVVWRFRGLVDAFSKGDRFERGLIILAHETSDASVQEVAKNIQTMETYAEKHGVRVEYYTLSDYFRVVRREEP